MTPLRMMLVAMMVVMMILRFLSELLVNKSASLISLSGCSSMIHFLDESIVVLVYNENRSPTLSQAGLRRLHTPEPRNETAAHIRIALILEVANVIGQPA